MPIAGIEPTSPRPQRGVLTTILNRPRAATYLISYQTFSSLRVLIIIKKQSDYYKIKFKS